MSSVPAMVPRTMPAMPPPEMVLGQSGLSRGGEEIIAVAGLVKREVYYGGLELC